MFSDQSNAELKAAGEGIYNVISGITDGSGVGTSDITAALQQVGLTQMCVDEIKADKPKAISAILGAALTKFSQS